MNADPADPHVVVASPEDLLQSVVIATEGMNSADCARRIEQALRDAKGVLSAIADDTSARVSVTFDPRKTSVAALHELIEEAGYEPSPYADLDFRGDDDFE